MAKFNSCITRGGGVRSLPKLELIEVSTNIAWCGQNMAEIIETDVYCAFVICPTWLGWIWACQFVDVSNFFLTLQLSGSPNLYF